MMTKTLLTLLLAVAASAALAQPVPMTVQEHFELAAGNTEVGKNDKGQDFAVYMSRDGRRRLQVKDSSGRVVFEDEGRLTIENDAYCSQWKAMNGGRKMWGIKVFRDGDKFRSARPDGTGSLHSFEPGNSRGLKEFD
jgi:hypothetical protein